jgi:hypothetical protein
MDTTLFLAAKFFLKHNGMIGTQKQIAKLLKQLPAEVIIRMARERGFKE